MATVVRQDKTIQENVVRAQAIFKEITDGAYDLEKVQRLATEIFESARAVIQNIVRGGDPLTELPTTVVVELNRSSPLPHLQSNLTTLTAILKAHRAMTEILWVKAVLNSDRPIYTETRDEIFVLVNKLKKTLPLYCSREGGKLVSASQAYYEMSCLKASATCLSPADGIWLPFIASIMPSVAGAGTGSLGELAGGVMGTFIKVKEFVNREWNADWYSSLWSLEWEATEIINDDQFEERIMPHIGNFIAKGGKYTLGLVKILMTIFENPAVDPGLKKRVIPILCGLVTIMPNDTLKESIRHPTQTLKKLVKKFDHYARTRSFSAALLFDISSRPENAEYRPRVIEEIKSWYEGLGTEKYVSKYISERSEAQRRLSDIQKQSEEATGRRDDLQKRFEEAAVYEEISERIEFRGQVGAENESKTIDELSDAINQEEDLLAGLAKEETEVSEVISVSTHIIEALTTKIASERTVLEELIKDLEG